MEDEILFGIEDFKDMILLPAGLRLYIAALTVEEKPTPRKCSDTDKVGVYFSFNIPYISECICYEYKRDLYVGVYELTNPVAVFKGKYSVEYGPHIDDEIKPEETPKYDPSEEIYTGEIFLTANEMPFVNYLGYYKMSLDEVIEKYGY